jgi:hypothetical protein
MKSKILISLLLALVMLFTLTAPAFAGRPAKAKVEAYNNPAEVVGTCSVQATHKGELKITVSLRGATPGTYYIKWLSGSINNPSGVSLGGGALPASFVVNADGRGRFSGIAVKSATYPFSSYPGDWKIKLFIYDDPSLITTPIYESQDGVYLLVTFK